MGSMKKTFLLLASLGAALLAGGSLVYAVDGSPRATLMSERDYEAARKEIERETQAAAKACNALRGYEQQVCTTEQAADRSARFADLEARYLGTVDAKLVARMAHINGQFEVETIRCEAFTGEAKGTCIQIAQDVRKTHADEARRAA